MTLSSISSIKLDKLKKRHIRRFLLLGFASNSQSISLLSIVYLATVYYASGFPDAIDQTHFAPAKFVVSPFKELISDSSNERRVMWWRSANVCR